MKQHDIESHPHAPYVRRVMAVARVHAPWRKALPHRAVRRVVQGVELWLPWSHRLPDYAQLCPTYGQNLVELAADLAVDGAPLKVIDVGANVGDSTKQIAARTDAVILAIEADQQYLPYLYRNVASMPGITIVDRLLAVSSDETRWTAARRGGTTHFAPGSPREATTDQSHQTKIITIDQLVDRYPDFNDVRLIKSDTDGFDTALIVSLARAYAASRPLLFFEFDPVLTSSVSHSDAQAVWPQLAELGYAEVAMWSHSGSPLIRCDLKDAVVASQRLLSKAEGQTRYLDVAAIHGADSVGSDALRHLIP